jgi:hypothetical protein
MTASTGRPLPGAAIAISLLKSAIRAESPATTYSPAISESEPERGIT